MIRRKSRVAVEDHAEQIVNLALEPVRHFPVLFHRGDFRIVPRQIDFENNLMVMRVGKQMVNDLDLFFLGPVERGQIRKHFEI